MLAEITFQTSMPVESIGEMDATLDCIANVIRADRPHAVHVVRANGDCLTIVLGDHNHALLNFIPASGDPPYFSSLGDPSAKGVFTFYVANDHHSEAPAWNVISIADGRDAVREFVAHSAGLPRNVAWVMD